VPSANLIFSTLPTTELVDDLDHTVGADQCQIFRARRATTTQEIVSTDDGGVVTQPEGGGAQVHGVRVASAILDKVVTAQIGPLNT
jgi:hypothetical protein